MSTYKTKNPLGSAAVKDLYDNAENFDKFVNDRTKEELEDRLGVLRKTWHGMEMIFSRFITYITGRGEQAVASIGWQELGNWATGLTVDNRQQIVYYNGSWYKYLGELEHVIAGDSPENDGGVWSAENPTGKWSNIGDAALRANLGSGDGIKWIGGLGYTTPEKYLARGDGVTDDTAALQLAIFEAKMSGREVLLSSMYLISDGFKLDSTVTIRGTGKASGFVTSDSITSQRILFHITADNVTLENFSILTSADGFGAVGSVGCYAIRVVDNVERTRICGLNIDGRHYGAMGFCTGISISWSNHGFYQNNNIQNCSVGFHGGGSFNVIDGNICDNHFVDDPDNFTNEWNSTSMYWDGFMFEGLKYSAITNNTATNNGQSGIYFGGGGSSVSCYNIISGNIA
ncbi:glycosyl hydrolase family 28-related protein, partial [Klebsiella quasipneumoniae subsp. similipneumoniae]